MFTFKSIWIWLNEDTRPAEVLLKVESVRKVVPIVCAGLNEKAPFRAAEQLHKFGNLLTQVIRNYETRCNASFLGLAA